MVRVAADWLVVKAATRKIAIAIVNGQFSARPPRAATIASSLLAMKVSAIQAIPKRAIIATIPDLKICVFGTSVAVHVREEQDQRGRAEHDHLDDRRHRHRLDAAALRGDRRPQALEDAEDADRGDARQEDRDAALRVGQQHDLTRRLPEA